MKKRAVIVLSIFLLVTLACNLQAGNPTTQAPDEKQQDSGPSSQAIRISEGLASLNSYRMTTTLITKGPLPTDSATIVIETQRSQEQDARYTRITQTSVKTGAEDPVTSESELYRIGNDQCSSSSGEWSWTSMPANQAEILDLTMNMLDFTPINDNPTFVGEETVNDIPANHFTFSVAGLGVESGAEVTANQGDYWLAVDGQYYVKYSLVLETVMDPETNVLHMETLIDLTDINQPVDIAFPQACLDVKLVTPEP
jgi:hypothetical protein